MAALLLAGCDASPKREAPSGVGGTAGTMHTGGTGGMSLAACDERPPVQVAACVGVEPSSSELRELTGVVQAVERPARRCGNQLLGDAPFGNSGDKAYAVVVSDGSVTMRVSLYLPWSTPIVNVGDTVTVSYDAEFPIESAPFGTVTLRDEAGELLLWLTMTYEELNKVRPTEIILSNGEASCLAKETSCGPVTEGPILATASDAQRVSIEQGEMADIGDFVVVNAQSRRGAACGWAEARAVIAVVRGSQELLARDVPDEPHTEEDAGL